ncbi:MAG: peptide chain release factor N(5)-glutamine methyltransferase [Bacteroidales bacterium]|jgi:release factor glutamine methyltransferase|nr:peptide chain release factor N(5)-glutamine methyltransferase [Bacteroidales bacterium]
MKVVYVRELLREIAENLGKLYADMPEGKAVAEMLLSEVFNTSRAGLYLMDEPIKDAAVLEKIENLYSRLMKNEPIQYVIGYAWFLDLKFKINSGALIPRPETEELVLWLINNHLNEQSDIEIVDICTGSGCIAISLKKAMPMAKVSAIDNSPKAIEIAKYNARLLNVDIDWILADVLSEDFNFKSEKKLIVISNPPYVKESEKANMSSRILNYEPESALFVPEQNPLVFYENILKKINANSIYFEINPLTLNEFDNLLKNYSYKVSYKKDFREKQRMILLEK